MLTTSWRGADEDEQVRLFIGHSFWMNTLEWERDMGKGNGSVSKTRELIKSIRPGDRVAMKSWCESGHTGHGEHSKLRIQAIGEVLRNYGDGLGLDVEWLDDSLEIIDVGERSYRRMVERVREEDIERIFNKSKREGDQRIHRQTLQDRAINLSRETRQSTTIIAQKLQQEYGPGPSARNFIFYGPPGTGKTYEILEKILPLFAFSDLRSLDLMSSNERCYEIVTFHPSFSYEDFVEGIRPLVQDQGPSGGPSGGGHVQYRVVDGVFKALCLRAHKRPQRPFALFIDEINRGQLSAIFGELITLLEEDKRGKAAVTLPYSRQRFQVPPNVYLFGTMNTADKSTQHWDIALRRRFHFIECPPQVEMIKGTFHPEIIRSLFLTLNERIEELLDRDHRLGHSYFMRINSLEDLRSVFQFQVIPLLRDYFYDDWEKMAMVLGRGLVKRRSQGKGGLSSVPDLGDLQAWAKKSGRFELTDPRQWTLETFKDLYQHSDRHKGPIKGTKRRNE